jgi:SAM-dependent methyltransferase
VSDAVSFTGERLHSGDDLFAVDLARHEAAYQLVRQRLAQGRVLDLGCGSGHGTASLAAHHPRVVGLDRIPPDARHRGAGHFVRADLRGLPFAPASFELVLSFQVIEHLEDPAEYLEGIARLMTPTGAAVLTTPNLLMSDGVNPFHVHEYMADELGERLRARFHEVEILGVGATEPVLAYLAARSARIRRIMHLDPLGLRNLLPRPLVEWLFGRLAKLVRRRTASDEGAPEVGWRDFPLGAADDRCLDLLAVCHRPR